MSNQHLELVESILDAATFWADQRDVGPGKALVAWHSFRYAVLEATRPAAALSSATPAVEGLAPIERDESMDRTYIPLPGGWEIQTQGKGSTFRICNTKTGDRWPVIEKQLHKALEQMARDAHAAALASRDVAAGVGAVRICETFDRACNEGPKCLGCPEGPKGQRISQPAPTVAEGDEQKTFDEWYTNAPQGQLSLFGAWQARGRLAGDEKPAAQSASIIDSVAVTLERAGESPSDARRLAAESVAALYAPQASQSAPGEAVARVGFDSTKVLMLRDDLPPGAPLYLHPATTHSAPVAAEVALRKVLQAVQKYLPPNGTPIQDAMSEIISCVDPWPLDSAPVAGMTDAEIERVANHLDAANPDWSWKDFARAIEAALREKAGGKP